MIIKVNGIFSYDNLVLTLVIHAMAGRKHLFLMVELHECDHIHRMLWARTLTDVDAWRKDRSILILFLHITFLQNL